MPKQLKIDMRFPPLVAMERSEAREKYPPINSVHEGYSVILEEIDEFWEEVKKKSEQRDHIGMYQELVQIAAMCQRVAEDVVKHEILLADSNAVLAEVGPRLAT